MYVVTCCLEHLFHLMLSISSSFSSSGQEEATPTHPQPVQGQGEAAVGRYSSNRRTFQCSPGESVAEDQKPRGHVELLPGKGSAPVGCKDDTHGKSKATGKAAAPGNQAVSPADNSDKQPSTGQRLRSH